MSNSENPRGYFVVFEGIDGSGKTTQITSVAQHLTNQGHSVLTTREPGGSAVAEEIRRLVLDPQFEVDELTEAYLFAAARSSHVRQVITPAVAAGRIVLSDRFVSSSIAYQGAGRGLGEDFIRKLNAPAVAEMIPDLTVVLDLDPSEGTRRRAVREAATGTTPDRIEQAPDEFQTLLRESFLSQAAAEPERFLVVDAGQGPATITKAILNRINETIATERMGC